MDLSIQPFYEQESVRIYHGDSYQLLSEIPDGSAGLVLTDPMYNIGFDYGNGLDDNQDHAVYEDQMDTFLDESLRISTAVIFTPGLANLAMWYGRHDIQPCWLVAWYKGNSSSSCPVGSSQWEPVLAYGEVENRRFPDIFHAPIDYDEEGYFHPTPKPELWAEELLKRFYTSGTTVLDPFMGSGTTAVVCLKYKIPYVGIDIVEKFCAGTVERLKKFETDEN